jgi:hypothetical protein
MKRLTQLIIVLIFFISPFSGTAQVRFQVHAGLSYIEHVSLGAGFNWRNHNVAVLYGSNFLIHPREFGSYFIQYHFSIPSLKFLNTTPMIGAKGGQTIFTDDYYRWNLVSMVPFVGIQRPLTSGIDVVFQGGVAFSFEQSVKRIAFGEIGHYKDRLPEVKAGIIYKLAKAHE